MPREFVVQKVGDNYVTVPVDHYPNATRTAYAVWGVVLALLGLNRRSLAGTALAAIGGAMVYRSDEIRHQKWPLRLGAEGTDQVVEIHIGALDLQAGVIGLRQQQ